MTIEITPMIDVVFLLIIFFMTTAQFAQMTRAEVDLPLERGEEEQEAEEAGLVINITADGTLIVASETVTMDGLERFVRDEIDRRPDRSPSGVKLLIRADRRTDTAVLNDVITRMQKLKVGAARMATEVP